MTVAAITSPSNREVLTVSVARTIVVYAPDDIVAGVDFKVDGTTQGAMTHVGAGVFNYTYTPGAVSASKTLTALGGASGLSASIVVTIDAANTQDQVLTGYNKSNTTVVTTADTPPVAGAQVYKIAPSSSGSARRLTYKDCVGGGTIFQNGFDLWVASPAGNITTVLSINDGGGIGIIDVVSEQNWASNMYSCVVETKVVGGLTWKRIQMKRLHSAASNGLNCYIDIQRDGVNTTYSLTSGEAAASGLLFCLIRRVDDVELPFLPAERIAIHYYGSTTSNGQTVEQWYYKHDYVNSETNMAGGADGTPNAYGSAPCMVLVLKPTSFNPAKKYRTLTVLPALLDSTEQSISPAGSHDTPLKAMTMYTNYCDLYDCIILIPFDRDGFLWWGCHSDGSANLHAFMGQVMPRMAEKFWNGSPNRNDRLLLGYSKSAWAAHSLMLLYANEYGFAAGWDSPLSGAWPNNNSTDAFTTQANFNLYDPIQILSSFGAVNRDRRRLLVMGYEVFQSETLTFQAALDAAGIPYYSRLVDEGVHSWGTTTWVPVAMQELFRIVNSPLNSMYFLGS